MLGWCYEGRGRGFFPAVAAPTLVGVETRLRADFGMWPYFAPNLALLGWSYAGLLPSVIKFVRYCGGWTWFGR